jgi:hypothetical protein
MQMQHEGYVIYRVLVTKVIVLIIKCAEAYSINVNSFSSYI